MTFDDLIVFLDANTTQILHNDLNYDLIPQQWGKKTILSAE